MNRNEFQEALQSGLGRAIVYARANDVRALRDVILDACLHCYSVDAQSEGTRAGYMLELVNTLPDRQFYCEEVLKALPGGEDDWDAAQRFHFATGMYFDGDERAKRVMYESFAPGPKFGESIAIDFVRMDGLSGLFFAAAKIGALIASRPKEVDLGWLWSQAIEICGEQEAQTALREAGAADPAIEAYRTAALERSITYGISRSEQAATPSYEQLKSSLPGVRAYRLSMWGKHASAEDLELAANGLAAAQTPEEQIQHLRMFSKRAFPLDPGPLLALALSPNEGVASAAAVALKLITDARVRDAAFELVEQRREGRHSSIAMLSQNREPNDHDIALRWFENESDRHTRHWMGMDLRSFWKRHPDPAGEIRMLSSLYERGPCSFCREYVVRRLLELESLSASIRAECAYDANDEVRSLVEAT